MSQKEATRSQSATTLVESNTSRAHNSTIVRAFKRLREDSSSAESSTAQLPSIIINEPPFNSDASTTVVSTEQVINTDKGDFLATKLDRLHDKNERYKSHKDFLVKCLEGNVIPKGLRLDLEPSIGNHDEEFLNKWYGKLEEFSKSFMNDVISFCDKTLTETEAKITDTDKQLLSNIQNNEYVAIKDTINTNNEMRNQTFKQRKMKKYHSLKYTKKDNQVNGFKVNYNDTRNNNTSYERAERPQQHPTYAAITKRVQPAHQLNNVHMAKQSQTNKPRIISRQNSATSLEIKDRLSLRKKRSNTNIMSNNKFKLQAQINNLQEQLQLLTNDPQEDKEAHITRKTDNQQKNVLPAQISSKGLNPEIEEVFDYINNAMQTLKEFENRFRSRAVTGMTPTRQ